MKGPYNKHIVREAMRGRIPRSVHERHDKMGFPSPAGAWMSELEDRIRDVLEGPFAREVGILDVAAIRSDFARHRAGQVDLGHEVFNVLQFLIWAQSIGGVTAARPTTNNT